MKTPQGGLETGISFEKENKFSEEFLALENCCGVRLGETLNDACFCVSLDSAALRHALESEVGTPGLFALLQERCPYVL